MFWRHWNWWGDGTSHWSTIMWMAEASPTTRAMNTYKQHFQFSTATVDIAASFYLRECHSWQLGLPGLEDVQILKWKCEQRKEKSQHVIFFLSRFICQKEKEHFSHFFSMLFFLLNTFYDIKLTNYFFLLQFRSVSFVTSVTSS